MKPVLWFVGLPGVGKSTCAAAVQRRLFKEQQQSIHIDADIWWETNWGNAPHTTDNRIRNLEHLATFCAKSCALECITILDSSAPRREARDLAISYMTMHKVPVHLFHLEAPLRVCEERAPEFYARARAGEVEEVPGLHFPYEHPLKCVKLDATRSIPDLVEECINICYDRIGLENSIGAGI